MIEYYKNLSLENIIYFDFSGEETIEEWRDVKEYEGLYRVSSLGRVRSSERMVSHSKGGKRHKKESILKSAINSDGYLIVGLHKNNIQTSQNVHILVAIAFLGHIPCGLELVVDHKNFIRNDCRLSNLRIITHRQNVSTTNKPKSSIYAGVSEVSKGHKKRWTSNIKINGEHFSLGVFDNELDAKEYYENAVLAIKNGTEIIVKRAVYSSRHKGVSWCKRDSKWLAQIKIEGKHKFLGRFSKEEDARDAYINALIFKPTQNEN